MADSPLHQDLGRGPEGQGAREKWSLQDGRGESSREGKPGSLQPADRSDRTGTQGGREERRW